ncbi:MAG: sialidase family protein [Gemmatimonadota bacterium]|nr:sialidase family protein [Gemmatimonadota bacterium]
MSRVLLLVGTRRGLFRVTSGPDRTGWRIEGPHVAGYEIYHALLDPRDGRTAWAAVRHDVWGTHVYRSRDAGRTWEALPDRPAFPADAGREVRAIWHLAPGGPDRPRRLWAGVQPGGLFRSDDAGETWEWIEALERHPTRAAWRPAKGGLALHSIQRDPGAPGRLYVALSAGGCYRTDDDGATWIPVNRGVRADFLPDPRPEAGHCVHCLRAHPGRPGRLYQQNHCGTWRSDDGGDTWTEITAGLPSDFGYVVGLDPSQPDRAWVIPEESSHLRAVCDARLRVYETADGGTSWTARTEGLPQEHAWVTVLREALATDGLDPCGVYFGTATGHLYVSRDGSRWDLVAAHLPKILSVSASVSAG